jgi:hypothetical protein
VTEGEDEDDFEIGFEDEDDNEDEDDFPWALSPSFNEKGCAGVFGINGGG